MWGDQLWVWWMGPSIPNPVVNSCHERCPLDWKSPILGQSQIDVLYQSCIVGICCLHISLSPTRLPYHFGGFHKWGYPHSWMVFVGENPNLKWMMDDDWGYQWTMTFEERHGGRLKPPLPRPREGLRLLSLTTRGWKYPKSSNLAVYGFRVGSITVYVGLCLFMQIWCDSHFTNMIRDGKRAPVWARPHVWSVNVIGDSLDLTLPDRNVCLILPDWLPVACTE